MSLPCSVGRKPTILYGVFTMVVSGVAASFVTSYWAHIFIRLVTGTASGGVHTSGFVMGKSSYQFGFYWCNTLCLVYDTRLYSPHMTTHMLQCKRHHSCTAWPIPCILTKLDPRICGTCTCLLCLCTTWPCGSHGDDRSCTAHGCRIIL